MHSIERTSLSVLYCNTENKQQLNSKELKERIYAIQPLRLTPDIREICHNTQQSWSPTKIDIIDWHHVHSKTLKQQHPYRKKSITKIKRLWLPTHNTRYHHGTIVQCVTHIMKQTITSWYAKTLTFKRNA